MRSKTLTYTNQTRAEYVLDNLTRMGLHASMTEDEGTWVVCYFRGEAPC